MLHKPPTGRVLRKRLTGHVLLKRLTERVLVQSMDGTCTTSCSGTLLQGRLYFPAAPLLPFCQPSLRAHLSSRRPSSTHSTVELLPGTLVAVAAGEVGSQKCLGQWALQPSELAIVAVPHLATALEEVRPVPLPMLQQREVIALSLPVGNPLSRLLTFDRTLIARKQPTQRPRCPKQQAHRSWPCRCIAPGRVTLPCLSSALDGCNERI